MAHLHAEYTAGKWQNLTLAEQLGNIGSEFGRVSNWQGRDQTKYQSSVDRLLELFDLTINDTRWRGRLKEICRLREILCSLLLADNRYRATIKEVERYFLHFAILARIDK